MFNRNMCGKTRDLLSPYIDGQLELKEQERVEEHLRSCEACARELDSLKATVALLRLTPAVKPPRSFVLREQVVPRPQPHFGLVLRWSTGLVAMLLLVLVGSELMMTVPLGGRAAPVSQMAQKSAEDRAVAPAGQAGGVTSQLESATQPPPADDSAKRSAQPSFSAPGVPPVAATSSGGVRDGDSPLLPPGDGPAEGSAQRATANAAGLPLLRIAQIGLGALVIALLGAGIATRRDRRS